MRNKTFYSRKWVKNGNFSVREIQGGRNCNQISNKAPSEKEIFYANLPPLLV